MAREFKMIASGINDMAGELGRMETMRQDFISNVSHEIQSPLTSIRGLQGRSEIRVSPRRREPVTWRSSRERADACRS